MQKMSHFKPEPVAEDSARIIFMRPSKYGTGILASLYEIQHDDIKFIGIINYKDKIAYDTTPGEHLFMVIGEAADFMKADLLPGKTYHSLVSPRDGVWGARFSLRPIRADGSTNYNTSSEQFPKWVNRTSWIEITPESLAWYEKHKEEITRKKEQYWPKWQGKAIEKQLEATLLKTDGQ